MEVLKLFHIGYHLYRVSLKKVLFNFHVISVYEVGLYFFTSVRNQNFKPITSSHSNYIHPES